MLEVKGFGKRYSFEYGLLVNVRGIAAVLCEPDIRMRVQVVLFIHNGGKAANEKQSVFFVEQPYLIGRQQLTATLSSGELTWL